MTNTQVIKSYLKGDNAKSLSLQTDGQSLYTYNTILAEKYNDTILVNDTKYSVTSSKHKGLLIGELESQGRNYERIQNVLIESKTLV